MVIGMGCHPPEAVTRGLVMANVRLKSGGKWLGTIPGGDLVAVIEGESLEVSDAQAAYLVGGGCSGAFEVSKPEKVKKG